MTSTSRPTDPTTARRALRREIPSSAAVLADEQDFTAMRRYRTFPFDDHRSYLRQVETLLRRLASQGVLTTVSLFDPAAYEKYCADLALDPDRPDSRSRYTAEVARTGATLTYQGEPLSQLLPLLVEEADRQATWDHASGVLARAGTCDACGADLAHLAFARATQALQELLTALGDGTHHLVCSVAAGEPSLLAVLHATSHDGARPRLAESETLVFCTVLAAGFALRTPAASSPAPPPLPPTATPPATNPTTRSAAGPSATPGYAPSAPPRSSPPTAPTPTPANRSHLSTPSTTPPGLPLTAPPDPHHH